MAGLERWVEAGEVEVGVVVERLNGEGSVEVVRGLVGAAALDEAVS